MPTRGLLVGKFAPLTRGHVSCIYRAASRVDELYVVLCYDEKFQKTLSADLQKRMTVAKRHLWLLQTFRRDPNIRILVVDESDIEAYPEGEAAFTKLVRAAVREQYGEIAFTHSFSSEPEYETYFSRHFPETEHGVIDADRALVPTRATDVRDNPYRKWDDLALAARPDFVKTVVVIGCESTGKSTLVRELTQHYGTVSVPEVGREICEDEFYNHEEYMNAGDYVTVAHAHKMAEREAMKAARKVLISDTNNLITEFSALLMDKDDERFASLSRAEAYDLVLYLDADVPWVGDNLRRNGDPTRRRETNTWLQRLCRERGVTNIVPIAGSYEQRYLAAVQAINKMIGEV